MTMTAPTLRALLDVAMDAAYLAGRSTLGHFQTGVRPDLKSDNTPVTIADREAEQILRARILRDFPTHAILGEEERRKRRAIRITAGSWIRSTAPKSFVAGVAALRRPRGRGSARRAVGRRHLPSRPLNDMVAAATGLGCTWNGRPCRVSDGGQNGGRTHPHLLGHELPESARTPTTRIASAHAPPAHLGRCFRLRHGRHRPRRR